MGQMIEEEGDEEQGLINTRATKPGSAMRPSQFDMYSKYNGDLTSPVDPPSFSGTIRGRNGGRVRA
jgi:hypothetical protein